MSNYTCSISHSIIDRGTLVQRRRLLDLISGTVSDKKKDQEVTTLKRTYDCGHRLEREENN